VVVDLSTLTKKSGSATDAKFFVVSGDAEWKLCRRQGRFSIPVECAASGQHLRAAVRQYQEKMITDLTKQGYVLLDKGIDTFEIKGPLEHIQYSDSVDPDPGPEGAPDPRDLEAMRRWERAERARTALNAGLKNQHGMVDYRIVATFRHQVRMRSILNRMARR
jgi:hypothetical protein